MRNREKFSFIHKGISFSGREKFVKRLPRRENEFKVLLSGGAQEKIELKFLR